MKPDPRLDKLTSMELLVNELTKPHPEEDKVRRCMQAVGLKYSSDPISRLSLVLEALERPDSKAPTRKAPL